MTGSAPTSPIHDADPVPFHQLDPLLFERLLVDLLQEEDGVVVAEQHGVSGQADFGVDAIGFHADGSCDLISCKRYQEITPGDLTTWSQDMLRHWATRWGGLRVRRFILATSAVNIARMQVVSQIPVEAERFRTLGVRYELWGPTRLRSKLAPHRRLAAMYLKEHWADAICGPAAPPPAPIATYTPIIEAGVLAQMTELQKMLSGEVAARVDAAVELLRQGRLEAVEALIAEVQEEPRWGQLTAEAQARVLRLEGSLALTGGDVAKAEACSLAADARHPPEEPRLAASIVAERHGAGSALEMLGRPTSLAGRQLRSALLLAAGRQDDALDELSALQAQDPGDPETLRLLALQRLSSGRPREALDLMIQVEAVAGNWMATRRTGAMVRYALALSPSLGPEWILVPNPTDPDLVRRDVEASSRLREAITLLDAIPRDLRSRDDETWRLAVLANIEGRRADAVQLARDLLERSPGDAMVVGWSVMRDFELDLGASRSVLEAAYRTGDETPQLRVLCLLLASIGKHEAAADFLEMHLDRQDEEQRAEAESWIARFRGAGMDGNSEILYNAQRHGDWGPAESMLEELLASDPPQPFGLTIAELVAAAGRWSVLMRYVDRLVAYGVPNGVRLAVTAAMNGHRYRKALDLIEAHASAFGIELPADVRRLRAEALARSGHYRSAIGEAATLAARGQLDDALFEAELRARIGAVQQAVSVVKRALSEGRLGSTVALQWSQRLKHVDPDLAKDLVRAAVSAGVEDAHVLAAWTEAVELGLHSESSQLMPRVAARAAEGDPSIRTMTVDTVQEFMRDLVADEERMHALRLSGAIPSHLYARGRADVLLRMHRLNLETAGGPSTVLHPRLVRHGARPLEHGSLRPYRSWTVHLDVTGLLEAERSGLLDRLEGHPNGIAVSSHLPEALQQMRSSIRGEAGTRAACERVLGLVASHVVQACEWIPTDMTRIRTDNEEGRGRTLPDLLGALSRTGIIGREKAIRQPDDAEAATNTDFQLPQELALSAQSILELASSGQLDRVCEHLSVVIEAATVEQIRTRLANVRNEEETAKAVSSLCQRIGDGIAAGQYRLLPMRPDTEGDFALERQLEDMLSLPASEGSVVWIDDRNLTGYLTADSVPIVGLFEVASAMLLSGDLSEDEHARIMTAYRASGAALLPFRTDEILEPLLAAPIVEEQLVETPELVAVRRAFAATRTLEPHLKIGPASDLLKDRPDEDLVARSTLRLFSEALAALWSDGRRSVPECLARSDWLLESLRIRRLFRAPGTGDSDDSRLVFEAMQIGHCLDKAWDIGGTRDEHADHRINYLNWCWHRLIVPRRGERPDIVDAVGAYLAQFYGALLDDGLPGSGVERMSYERILLLRTRRLPEPIAACIRNAGIFPHHVRISKGVQLAGHRIESGRFWRAMREAARYGSSSLRTEGGRRLCLRRSGDRIAVSGRRMQLPIDVARVLAADPAQVRAASASFLERLDLLPSDATDFQDRALLQREPSAIASVLQAAEDASVREKRRQVERLLAQRRGVPLADLEPPSPDRLAWHHRIDLEEDSSARRTWDVLTQQVGAVEAFVRSAALPFLLPEGGAVDASELDQMVAAARTPIALASAGRLLREASRGTDEIVALTVRFVEAVERWGRPMVEVLQWTIWRTRVDRSWASIQPQAMLRLCWLHVDWIVATFERHGFDPDVLIGSFPIKAERLSAVDRLAMTPAGPADQADPGTVTPVALLMHGLAAILGEMDAETTLPADLLARIRSSALSQSGDEVVDPNLLLRDPEQGDALGGFMLAMPAGILKTADLPAARATYVDQAIARLREDSDDREAWLGLVAFGVRGLDRERTEALVDLLEEIDLFAAADLTGPDPQPFVWRGVLGPLAWADEPIETRIATLASRCARTFAGPLRPKSPAEVALNELVESCFYASREPTAGIDLERARALLWAIATQWTASAPLMRRMVSSLLDGAAPVGKDILWRLGNDLNRLQ